jgi:hypothetical protein
MIVDITMTKDEAQWILAQSTIPVEFLHQLVAKIWGDIKEENEQNAQL